MGRDIEGVDFTRADRLAFRHKVKADLAVLHELVDSGSFESGRRTCGVELEVHLVDPAGDAAPIGTTLLETLGPAGFESELAQFTVEFDAQPRPLTGRFLDELAADLRGSLEGADTAAGRLGAEAILIGILPTLTEADLVEQHMSPNPRYRALNDMILASRGEDILIDIEGPEELHVQASSVMFEAACSSMQLHLQVDPHAFGVHWNAAQVLSGPLVAVAANSPLFLGRRLHQETRVALFERSIEPRSEELVRQGVRPRVWFGEKWLDEGEGLWNLFEENSRYFSPILPECDGEEPLAVLLDGEVPLLPELTLHNGTIWRWNRPVYEVVEGRPHMRIENRVLPAGPTVEDCVANAAFYYGLLHGLVSSPRPHLWEQMSFGTVADNFYTAARQGLEARLRWPRLGTQVPVGELVLGHLLPLARKGLLDGGADAGDVEHYLGIIEARVASGQNGAAWQVATWERVLRDGGLGRADAARRLVQAYQERSRTGAPVHTWSAWEG